MNFDVDMAHHAGCRACAVTYGNGTREQLADAKFAKEELPFAGELYIAVLLSVLHLLDEAL